MFCVTRSKPAGEVRMGLRKVGVERVGEGHVMRCSSARWGFCPCCFLGGIDESLNIPHDTKSNQIKMRILTT